VNRAGSPLAGPDGLSAPLPWGRSFWVQPPLKPQVTCEPIIVQRAKKPKYSRRRLIVAPN
jgi:hypothetical protein